MKKIRILIMSIICLLIPGCNNNSIDYYNNKKNKLDLKSFFNGEVEGWGAIFDYQGRQARSFYVTLKGSWDKNNGTLEEWFVFDDDERTERTWSINFSDEFKFTGTAKDIIDEAYGKQNGNAVNIKYILSVPYKGSNVNINMDDWMYGIENNIILNRTSMKKFGFKVGEIVLFMKKK